MTESPSYNSFADLLSRRKFATGKTMAQISRELMVGITGISHWHNALAFPGKEKLPAIAKAYDVGVEELTAAYNLAKEARSKEGSRFRAKIKSTDHKQILDVSVYGTIGGKGTLSRSNPQLLSRSFGRR